MVENEKDFADKIKLIQTQKHKMWLENRQTTSSNAKSTGDSLTKKYNKQKKYLKMGKDQGNVELFFYWYPQAKLSNNIHPTQKQMERLFESQQPKIPETDKPAEEKPTTPESAESKNPESSGANSVGGTSDDQPKTGTSKPEESKPTKDELPKEPEKPAQEPKTSPNTSNEDGKKSLNEADTKTPDLENKSTDKTKNETEKSDPANEKTEDKQSSKSGLTIVQSSKIPEFQPILFDDGSGLENKAYTYYDYHAKNKLFMHIKIYDDQYSDEHRFTVTFLLNFKNLISMESVETKTITIPSKDSENKLIIIDDKNNQKSPTGTASDKDKTEDPKSEGTQEKPEPSETADDGSKLASPTGTADKPQNQAQGTKTEAKPTKLHRVLTMDIGSAIIEPNRNFTLLTGFSMFDFNHSFYCKIKGHLSFDESAFDDQTSPRTIKINKFISSKELIKLKLYSDEPGCGMNFDAVLRYNEPKHVKKAILFVLFVLTLGK